MINNNGELIQAIEWRAGMPVSSGDFKSVSLIHCVEAGNIKAKFDAGEETRLFKAGDDFSLRNIDITVVSGKFDINV